MAKIQLNENDVIRVGNSVDHTLLTKDLTAQIHRVIPQPYTSMATSTGLNIDFLCENGKWTQGKVKITFVVEFKDEEKSEDHDSSLDDIRHLGG
jgi:hypothetical protein